MRCVSAYKYIIDKAKMTELVLVYPQAYSFLGQSSKYTFECIVNNLGNMVSLCCTPLLVLIVLLFYVEGSHWAVGADVCQEFVLY